VVDKHQIQQVYKCSDFVPVTRSKIGVILTLLPDMHVFLIAKVQLKREYGAPHAPPHFFPFSGSGKTIWAQQYMLLHPDKQYMLLSPETVLDQMRVSFVIAYKNKLRKEN
jgi:hypothetical protein